jgi:hypothetical protein
MAGSCKNRQEEVWYFRVSDLMSFGVHLSFPTFNILLGLNFYFHSDRLQNFLFFFFKSLHCIENVIFQHFFHIIFIFS